MKIRTESAVADGAFAVSERDPSAARWLAEAVPDRIRPAGKPVAALLAAAGEKVRRADPSALSAFAGSRAKTRRSADTYDPAPAPTCRAEWVPSGARVIAAASRGSDRRRVR